MKHLDKIVAVLLNLLLCGALLWFFTHNSILRPYAGSSFKETIAGALLLGSLYLNYFLLYPKLYQKHSHIIYWLTLSVVALVTGGLDLAVAYPNIISCGAPIIEVVGLFNYFSKILLFIVGRNLALNFFPFLFRERHHYQQAFENEVRVVYQDVRKLDVVDGHSNIHLVSIDDIFYCQQKGNFTYIYLVQNKYYTRTCSMKHLEQLFGDDFVRITNSELVPFRYIKACKNNTVVMKKMPWEEEQTTFKLEPKNQEEISEKVVEGLLRYRAAAGGKNLPRRPARPKTKRKPVTPPEEKLTAVLTYIKRHPNCSSKDIVNETKIPLSTVERCIAVLKKQGHIEHTGSKKKGGYGVLTVSQEENAAEPTQHENVAEEKATGEKSVGNNVSMTSHSS